MATCSNSAVLALIREELCLDEVSENSKLRDLTSDSMELLSLAAAIEDAFGLDLEDIHKISTVQDLITYVDSHSR